MNRIRALGLSLAATAAATASAADAPPGPRPADARPWYGKLLGGDKPAEKPADTDKPKPAAVRPPVIIAPLAADVLAEAVRAEEQACARRLEVCTKLRQAAADRGDDKLTRTVDEMERQAVELCQARVARLGVKTTARTSARADLDAKLGTGAAVDPLAVAAPAPAGRPATAEARGVRP